MLGKLCVCGHEMKPQGKQTLEMNGSSLGSNLWTDHVFYDANPDMLRAVARERIEELESIERYKTEQKQKEEERRAKRKKLFSGILGRDEDDGKPPKNRPPEF